MSRMFDQHAPMGLGKHVYDVGSFNINGDYRNIADRHGWEYLGLDIVPGRNVDIVIDPLASSWLDPEMKKAPLVISGQCLEHTEWPWKWISQVRSLMEKGALLFLIAPAAWPEHKHPKDCWRILPDGMFALADWASMEVLETGLTYAQKVQNRDGEDCWGVLRAKND